MIGERNWDAPEIRAADGDPNCEHSFALTIWHQTQVSMQEGRVALGHVVTLVKETRTCTVCGHVHTTVLSAEQPSASDLKRHWELQGKTVPEAHLRRLKIFEHQQAEAAKKAAKKAEREAAKAAAKAPPESEDDEQETELNADDLPLPGEGDLTDSVAEGLLNDEREAPGVNDYWKVLQTIQVIQKKGMDDSPFTNPNSMFQVLMEEANAVTGEHSMEHLYAALADLSRHLTGDIEEIRNFTSMILNFGGQWTPVMCSLAHQWGLVRLEDDETWIPFDSALSQFLFDSWLQIPQEEVYANPLRQTPGGVETDPNAPPLEESTGSKALMKEIRSKAREASKKEAAAKEEAAPQVEISDPQKDVLTRILGGEELSEEEKAMVHKTLTQDGTIERDPETGMEVEPGSKPAPGGGIGVVLTPEGYRAPGDANPEPPKPQGPNETAYAFGNDVPAGHVRADTPGGPQDIPVQEDGTVDLPPEAVSITYKATAFSRPPEGGESIPPAERAGELSEDDFAELLDSAQPRVTTADEEQAKAAWDAHRQGKTRAELYELLHLNTGKQAETDAPGTRLRIINLTPQNVGIQMMLVEDLLTLVIGSGGTSKED